MFSSEEILLMKGCDEECVTVVLILTPIYRYRIAHTSGADARSSPPHLFLVATTFVVFSVNAAMTYSFSLSVSYFIFFLLMYQRGE